MKYNVNLKEIADELGFEIEDVEMIMEIFLESAKENLINIKNAIEKDDRKNLAEFAHAIKGSALNLRLNEIAKLAKEIEIKAKNNEEADYKNKYEKLKELINNIKS
jgi:HPt (histidine-containing phosphotransfer) domain-containing protein